MKRGRVDRDSGDKVPTKKRKLVGLPNMGNTCFFNATIQILAHTKGLLSHLQRNEKRKYEIQCKSKVLTVEVGDGDGPLTGALCAFLATFEKGNPKMIRTTLKELYKQIENKYERFRHNEQQDSAELLRCLLDGIRKEEIEAVKTEIDKQLSEEENDVMSETEKNLLLKEAKRLASKVKTPIDELFGGAVLNTVICRECLQPTQLVEPFLDVCIPIPDEDSCCVEHHYPNDDDPATNKAENPKLLYELLKSRGMHVRMTNEPSSTSVDDLEQCLKEHTSLDVLDDDNKFICQKCTADRQSDIGPNEYAECLVSKQLLLHSLPSFLIMNIKRFHLGQVVTKNNRHVKFPRSLNIAPFCSDACQKYCSDEEDMKIMYGLYGVVEHSGTLHSGHYSARVKLSSSGDNAQPPSSSSTSLLVGQSDETTEEWCLASDSSARLTDIDEVLSSQAYLLFYELS